MPLVSIAAYTEANTSIVHVDRTADFHVLIYVLKGNMEIIEDGTSYKLEERSLFFLKANVHHWGVKAFELGTCWQYIHFYAPEPSEDLQPLELQKSHNENRYWGITRYRYFITLPKLIVLPPNSEIAGEIHELINQFQSSRLSDLIEVNLMLWKLLLNCYQINNYREEEQSIRKRVKKIAQFLEDNFTRQFTQEEIEGALGLSYKYIGTILKNETGMTIKEYQQMLRIKEAEKLLCFSDLSATEISERIGYHDVFYFSNVFKKERGLSPIHFRSMYTPLI
jgi:AraC-like DNA-binding protein